MKDQAVHLLKEVLRNAELYNGKVSASTLLDIKNYVDAHNAVNALSNEEILSECRLLADKGQQVEGVKRFRALTGCSLREAYLAVTKS